MPKVTIVSDTAREVDAVVRGERILLEPEFLQAAIGWTLKPRSLCGGACVPCANRQRCSRRLVDLASVAAALGAASSSTPPRQWLPSAQRGRAPDRPDRQGGRLHPARPRRHAAPLLGVARQEALWSRSRAGAAVATTSGWQALHDELAGDNFMVWPSPSTIGRRRHPWVEGLTIPSSSTPARPDRALRHLERADGGVGRRGRRIARPTPWPLGPTRSPTSPAWPPSRT